MFFCHSRLCLLHRVLCGWLLGAARGEFDTCYCSCCCCCCRCCCCSCGSGCSLTCVRQGVSYLNISCGSQSCANLEKLSCGYGLLGHRFAIYFWRMLGKGGISKRLSSESSFCVFLVEQGYVLDLYWKKHSTFKHMRHKSIPESLFFPLQLLQRRKQVQTDEKREAVSLADFQIFEFRTTKFRACAIKSHMRLLNSRAEEKGFES